LARDLVLDSVQGAEVKTTFAGSLGRGFSARNRGTEHVQINVLSAPRAELEATLLGGQLPHAKALALPHPVRRSR